MAGQPIVLVTVFAALLQTADAATQATTAQVESGPHVSRFAAGEGCVIFNDQAEFEAAMEQGGWVLAGMETFSEAILMGVFGFDDPLCGGIPALPIGFPFPNGLDVQNLCLQSNLEHNPGAPNPRGVDGLVAVGAGWFGVSSDVVLALEFVDSLDLMFTEPNPTAVGFNPISLLGGDVVDVRVYDTSNTLLTTTTSPADAPGQHFWGVLCPDAIGRINIFDTGNGAEGGDNIQMWVIGSACGPCATDVDGSGDTGASDMAVLLGSWGPCAPGDMCVCLDADDDATIDAADLAVLLGAWGPCP